MTTSVTSEASAEDVETSGAPPGSTKPRRRLRLRLNRQYWLLVILFLILGVLVVLPLGILLVATVVDAPIRPGTPLGNFTLENFARLTESRSIEAMRNTFIIGVGGTAMAMAFGCVLAWLTARTDVPFKPLVQLAGVVPLFTSALVGALAWGLIASPRQGYINLLFRDLGIPVTINIYSIGGMIFVFGLYYAPYAYLLVNSALTLMNPELEEAAEVHGASRGRVARLITFKLVTPAVLGAGMLTSVLIMENFAVPHILGTPNGIATLPSQIYRDMRMAPSRPNQAATIGLMLMVITATLVYVQKRVLARREYVTVSGKGFKPREISLGGWRWAGLAFAVLYLILAVGLPFFALGQSALRAHVYIPDFAALFDLQAFSFGTFERVWNMRAFRSAVRNSLLSGGGAAVLGGILFSAMSYAVYRTKLRGRTMIEYLAMWPLAVPALVIGMGFLWTWIRLPLPIYGTLWILMFAYIARFMPQGFRGISATIGQVHKELEESAHVSGAGRLRTAISIVFPLIRTGVISTMVLILILSMRELSVAIFLFTSRTTVLSVLIFNQWDQGAWSVVAAMSLLYSALLVGITLVARRWFGLSGS